jgi:hypothetical protein
MAQLVELITKVLRGIVEWYGERGMRTAEDALRRSSQANAGNCLRPGIGSKEDRLYQRMAAKGYLIRTPLGYMLPEFNPRAVGQPF